MSTKLSRTLLVLISIPPLALSQFGLPTFIDPVQSAHVLTEIAKIIQIYTLASQTYNQIAYSAGWTPIRTPWLGIATPIVLSNTRTIFGETGGWNPAVTASINIPGAWSTATYGIHPPPFYARYPLGASSISADIASIMIADGASQAAMKSIANSRTNQPINDMALGSLEAFAQDTTLGTNSEIEQLNQLSSSHVLANRQQEDANALLTSIAEQQIIIGKIQRDTLAANLNTIGICDTYMATQATQWGGDAQLFASYSQ